MQYKIADTIKVNLFLVTRNFLRADSAAQMSIFFFQTNFKIIKEQNLAVQK